MSALRRRWLDYQPILADLFAPVPLADARSLYFGRAEPAFAGVKAAAAALLTLNQDAMVHKSDHARRVAEQVSQIATLSSLAAIRWRPFVCCSPRACCGRSSICAMPRAGWGRRAGARAAVRGHDEIAHLASDFNAMAQQIQRYRQSSLGELWRRSKQRSRRSTAWPIRWWSSMAAVASPT